MITDRIPLHDIAQDVLVIVELISGKQSRRPSEPMLIDKLGVYSFLLACRSFESPGHENGSNWVQRELRNLQAKKLLTSMTRLIEEALCGSKRGSQNLWSLLSLSGLRS